MRTCVQFYFQNFNFIFKNQNPGIQSREMGKSLGRERNFEEGSFESGKEYW